MGRIEDWARFLEKNLKSVDFKEATNDRIDQCVELIRQGHSMESAQKTTGFSKKDFSIIFELAHSRIKIREKFDQWNRLWMDEYLASYSTPEAVCRYRSAKISDFNVIEAGSGAGMQSIFLSSTNSSVLSLEIQPERYRMSRLNAQEFRTGKLNFVNGDIYHLSPQVEIGPDTLIFSDPARPKTENERSMSNLIPSPENLIKIFGKKTGNFVFDLPPQMKRENITIGGEKEYLSIGGKLNRLTLYLGRLAKDEVSAVMLPEQIKYSGTPAELKLEQGAALLDYILVPDISLVYAKLLWKVQEDFDAHFVWSDSRRYVFSSRDIQTRFPGEQFEILWIGNEHSIPSGLSKHNVGKVFPRFSLTDREYYRVKTNLERGLNGESDAYIFRNGDSYYITKKV